jgi:hypothetical protein
VHKSKGKRIVWKGKLGSILSTIHQDNLAEIFCKRSRASPPGRWPGH